MMIRLLALLLTTTLLAISVSTSTAGEWEDWLGGGILLLSDTNSDETSWHGNAAVGIGLTPAFHGSVNYEMTLLPLIDLEWRDRVFLSTQRGIGFNAVRQNHTKAGPRITFDWGRDPSDHTDLANTPSVGRTTEAGLFLIHYHGPWRVDGDIRIGISGGHDAIRAKIAVAYGRRINAETSLILGTGLDLNSANFNQAFYDDRRSGLSEMWARADVVYEFETQLYISISVKGGALSGPTKNASYTGGSSFFTGALIGRHF